MFPCPECGCGSCFLADITVQMKLLRLFDIVEVPPVLTDYHALTFISMSAAERRHGSGFDVMGLGFVCYEDLCEGLQH